MIQYQPQPPAPPVTCSTSLTSRMAEQMREMAFAGETVNTETLVSRGWTLPAIKRLSPAAITQARRLSVRRVA